MFWFLVRVHVFEEDWDFRDRNSWYKLFVCPGAETTVEMAYNSQGKNLTGIKKQHKIRCKKLTHAMRSSGAQAAQANG